MGRRRDSSLDLSARSAASDNALARPNVPVVDNRPPEPMDPAHRAAVEQALERARRRDFATDEQIEAAFARFSPP